MADLFATVLRPIAEQRGLETWEQLAAYAAEEWVPSRIAFGKHKGRSIAEARTDAGLRRWLDGLAQFANARNARMGRWYLRSLEAAAEPSLFVAWECSSCPSSSLGTRLSAKLGFVGVDKSARCDSNGDAGEAELPRQGRDQAGAWSRGFTR